MSFWLLCLVSIVTANDAMFDAKVTFIIKTHDRPQCLRKLLDSLRLYYPTTHVLVADDGELSLRTRQHASSHIVELPYDVGLSAARNAMLERVKTPYFVTLDDDFVL